MYFKQIAKLSREQDVIDSLKALCYILHLCLLYIYIYSVIGIELGDIKPVANE